MTVFRHSDTLSLIALPTGKARSAKECTTMEKDAREDGLRAGAGAQIETSFAPMPASLPKKRTRALSRSPGTKAEPPGAQTQRNKPSANALTPSMSPPPERYHGPPKKNEEPEAELVNNPRLLAEAGIELMSAKLRFQFLNEFPVFDEMALQNKIVGEGGSLNTAHKWREAGQIIGLPFAGMVLYPEFQFQSNGQPYPLIIEVNKAINSDYSDWQRALWLVTENEWLNTLTPISAIQNGDSRAIRAAGLAGKPLIW